MKSSRINLAEKFLLLALDDEKGRFHATNSISLSYGLAASILVVIALRREIQVDAEGKLAVVERRSEEAVLEKTLDLIETSAIDYPIQYWVCRVARNHLRNQQIMLTDLCEKGILFEKDTEVGTSFNIKHYPTRNPGPENSLREEISNYIQGKEKLKPSLFFLLILIHACGIFEEVFEEEQRDIAKDKLQEIEKGEIPSSRLRPETSAILESIRAALQRLLS